MWVRLSQNFRNQIRWLIIVVRSNPRWLFSFHAGSNAGHYQSTMTSHNDLCMWCRERKVRFLLKRQTSARNTPRTRAFITLRDDRHVWTDQNSLTGIDGRWVERNFGKVFLQKLHLKCIKNVLILEMISIYLTLVWFEDLYKDPDSRNNEIFQANVT